jgi:hypothetical protein
MDYQAADGGEAQASQDEQAEPGISGVSTTAACPNQRAA